MAMKWAQFTQEKQQPQVHFYVSFIYFYIYA